MRKDIKPWHRAHSHCTRGEVALAFPWPILFLAAGKRFPFARCEVRRGGSGAVSDIATQRRPLANTALPIRQLRSYHVVLLRGLVGSAGTPVMVLSAACSGHVLSASAIRASISSLVCPL